MLSTPSYKVKCPESNNGTKICTTQTCTLPAINCSDDECPCQSNHEDCINSTSLKVIVNKLMVKDKSSEPCYQLVLDYFDSLIKQVNIHKDMVKKAVEDGGTLLETNEQKFLSSVKLQNCSDVTGKMMAQVTQSVIRNPKVDTEAVNTKIKKAIEGFQKQTDTIFSGLKRLLGIQKGLKNQEPQTKIVNYSTSQKLDFKFSQTFKGNNIHIDSIKNSIKVIGKYNNFIILEPSLKEIGKRSVTLAFKVVRCYYVYIGIVSKQIIASKEFKLNIGSADEGHLISVSGSVTSTLAKNKSEKCKGFDSGQTIHLTYNGFARTLKMVNLDKKMDQIELTIPESSDSMHFGIAMSEGAYPAEVQFLGQVN